MVNHAVPACPSHSSAQSQKLSAASDSSGGGGAAAFMSCLNSSKPMAPDPSVSQPVRSLDSSELPSVPSTCHVR